MPEEEVEYKVEQEPMLLCPFKVHAAIVSGRVIDTACFKEECAWWDILWDKCSIASLSCIAGQLADLIAND